MDGCTHYTIIEDGHDNVICRTYDEYLAYFRELKRQGKGTRWIIAENRRKYVNCYLRVVQES